MVGLVLVVVLDRRLEVVRGMIRWYVGMLPFAIVARLVRRFSGAQEWTLWECPTHEILIRKKRKVRP